MAGGFARIRIKLRRPAIQREQVAASNRSSRQAADTTQGRVKDNMRKKGRVKTGRMVASVRTTPLQVGTQTWYRVHSDLEYTRYQEEGVSQVVARPGGRLRFMGKTGVYVFPKRTKGFRGGHFFRDALKDVKERDFDTGA